MPRILVVEDEAALSLMLRYNLEAARYIGRHRVARRRGRDQAAGKPARSASFLIGCCRECRASRFADIFAPARRRASCRSSCSPRAARKASAYAACRPGRTITSSSRSPCRSCSRASVRSCAAPRRRRWRTCLSFGDSKWTGRKGGCRGPAGRSSLARRNIVCWNI